MLVVGSIVSGAATEVGFMAGSIAVGGFIAHVPSALKRKDDLTLRVATVGGGLAGLAFSILVTIGATAVG